MHRFFVEICLGDTIEFKISGDDLVHIKKVLRLEPSDRIVVCDTASDDYLCSIVKYTKEYAVVKRLHKLTNNSEPELKIRLFQGIPKSDKMDWIVQKATELGVCEIIPMITERTIVKFKDEKAQEKKKERWQRIAKEAGKQSGRNRVPEIQKPVIFKEAISKYIKNSLSIMPYVKEKERGLKNIIKGISQCEVSIFIGPEGGFSEIEAEEAERNGIALVTLGPRILRSETAGLAVISILMYELGDVGR